MPVADLEGAEPAPRPPLGDGLTPSLTVTTVLILRRHHHHFCLFKHVKKILRIFKVIATSGFVTALERTKFVFGWGSAPDPTAGAYIAPPDPVFGLRGLTSKGRGKGGKRDGKGERSEGKRRGRDGR